MKNRFLKMVDSFERVFEDGHNIQLGAAEPLKLQKVRNDCKMLMFSPHPDDECIIGALPLRLRKDYAVDVKNVAVTLGSNVAERSRRLDELKDACNFFGFELIVASEPGLNKVNLDCRENDRNLWDDNVEAIEKILRNEMPDIITIPNVDDANTTHVGVRYVVLDAIARIEGFKCVVIETEFWGANKVPNLMVESSNQDVSELITGLSFHKGEVSRNPYHLTLCAWMMDNVRRGGELVGGQGGGVPDFIYATLYRCSRFKDGHLVPMYEKGKIVSVDDSLEFLINSNSI